MLPSPADLYLRAVPASAAARLRDDPLLVDVWTGAGADDPEWVALRLARLEAVGAADGVIGRARAELARLTADPPPAPSHGFGKAAAGVGFLVGVEATEPLLRGASVGSVRGAHLVPPADVARVAAALVDVARPDPSALSRANVDPVGQSWAEADLDWLLGTYAALRRVVADAAAAGDAILVWYA